MFDLNFLIFPPQLTRQEEQSLSIEKYGEERAVRRLNIILSLKQAYLKAMGQPIGFDFLWINCDVVKEVITVDHSTLDGWEFNILTANIDSHKKTNLMPHPSHILPLSPSFWHTLLAPTHPCQYPPHPIH